MKTLRLAALVAAPLTAHAQDLNFGAIEPGANVATVTSGAEDGLVVGVGYARALAIANRPIVLGGDASLVWAELDPNDFRVRAGVAAPIVDHGRWKLVGAITPTLRGTTNETARMIGVSTDLAVLAGHYAPRWFAAVEGGFDWALATHITHSDAYRMLVYPDARDGWYGNPGGMFRYGIQGGVSFGGNDVILRAGKLVDISGSAPMFPIYGTLTYDRRW